MRIAGPIRNLFDAWVGMRHRHWIASRPSELALRGLHGPVEIVTDTFGVPHIYADTGDDLFFAQGYVTARDRLFQMDYNRHGARGRLCELVGRRPVPWRSLTVHLKERTTYDVDVMVRTFGLERAARRSLDLMSADARAVVKAYAAGVNAYLAHLPWPLEHLILRRQAPPWTEIDSLVLVKAIAFELNYAWRAILFGAQLLAANVPEEIAAALGPAFPNAGAPVVDSAAWKRIAEDLGGTRSAVAAALGISPNSGAGSNCFAVAGSHTKDGSALLANDTHLTLTAPAPWHEVRLLGGGFDLRGFQLPGVPGIGIGRNRDNLWGITAGLVQDLDIFVEELHPDDPTRYRTPEGYASLDSREEVIHVRGEGFTRQTIYESRHGPLLETVATLPDPKYRFAVCWTGHQPSSELDTLLDVWRSTDMASFHDALRHHGCPTFNMTYAGADGRIAYFLAGSIPKRKLGTPLRPLEGWTGEWDWDGVVPFDENPAEINPSRGYIVTANNRVGPWDYPYELGALFEPPDRFERISELLRARGHRVTFDDLAAVQLDDHASWAAEARDDLLEAVGGVDRIAPETQTLERAAAELWAAWDGSAGVDSAGATLGYMVPLFFGQEIVRAVAGPDAAHGFIELSSAVGPSISRLIRMGPRLSEYGVDLTATATLALGRAVRICRQRMGDDLAAWRWGDVHPLIARHRFGDSGLGQLFCIGPEPCAGGPDSINRGDVNAAVDFSLRVGPAMRLVADAKQVDRAGTIIPGGQSGDRLSPHYDDQLIDFIAGRLKSAPMNRARVEVAVTERFVPIGDAANPDNES